MPDRLPPVVCFLLVLGLLSTPARPQAATRPSDQTDVPVKEVVLFSSGVGYFEHAGSVHDDGITTLHFKTDQINDILKSLLLEDLDGGKVGTVSYPNPAPLARTLKSFGVDITSNPPLWDLLNQLRGARVSLATVGGPVEGVILGVEKKQKVIADKQIVDEYVLNLRSARSVRPIPLDQVQSLEMEDAKLNQELDAALTALAQARDQDKKPVEIRFAGQGDRRVRIGYVVETPVWKTSYRLVLDGKPQKDNAPGGKIQGWAIVENQTDTDWNNVELSLVSGRPISFIEDLYHSLYIPRPYVQSQLYASLTPQTYENGISRADLDKLQQQQAAQNLMPGGQMGRGSSAGLGVSNTLFAGARQASQAGEPLPVIDPTASVVSAASAAGLGELFQYTVGNVSIQRQQSAMIPIVTDNIDIKKVSIYNRATLLAHPLNGIRLKNTTKKHLLTGPVTVIEGGSYAGDARIDDVPPDERRLLSYGIDLKVNVVVNDEPKPGTVQIASVVRGVLHLQWKDVSQTKYVFSNHSGQQRTLVLEHPLQQGWKLAEPAQADETTNSFYRFVRPIAADKPLEMTLRTELVRQEQIAILPLDMDRLVIYSKLDHLPQGVRDAFAQIIQMKQAVTVTQQQLEDRRHRIAEISAEQSRIRENMKAVSQSTDYYARLIKKLDEQETQIESIQKEIDTLAAKLDAQQKDLESRIAGLTVE
jgi:hypothetical protein